MRDFRRNEPIRKAAVGLSDMTVFAAIQNMMEGSLLYDHGSQEAADKIIAVCRREQQRLLKIHSNGVAAIERGDATRATP